MGERCNKCKVSFRSGGDTWCIGCSAWETIGLELCGRWPGPCGVRRIADDIALSAARHIRALRSFGAGIGPAPSDQGAGSVKEEKGEDKKAGSREVPGLAAKLRQKPLSRKVSTSTPTRKEKRLRKKEPDLLDPDVWILDQPWKGRQGAKVRGGQTSTVEKRGLK